LFSGASSWRARPSHGLSAREREERPPLLHELFIAPHLHEAPALEDDDGVRVTDGGQAVRDHHARHA